MITPTRDSKTTSSWIWYTFERRKRGWGGGGEELLATTQYLIHKDKRENLDLEI